MMILFIEIIDCLYIILFQRKRIPLLAEYLPVLVGYVVGTFASFCNHGVGLFPVSSELSHIFLLGAPDVVFQDQVTDLEFASLHLLVMYDLDLLLVGRDPDCGLSPPFFGLILHQSELSDVLIPNDLSRAQCRHINIDRDDDFHPIG